MKKVYLLLAAVIFSFCSAFAEEVDLTRAMFHEWDNYEANANIVGDGGCDFVLGTSTGMPYGNGSVIGAQYADLSEYTELKLTVTEGTPRLLLNRPHMGDSGVADYLEIKSADNEYVSVEENVWTVDITAIVAKDGYCHLNAIKGANWANVTITAMKLVKAEGGAGPEPEPEPEPVAPAAQEEVTDLTKDMFKEWTLPTIGAEEKGPGYGAYDFNVSTGLAYGDGNVDKNHYADVSAYDYLDITVKEGTPRPLFNRDIDGGQAPDHLIDMPNNAAQTAKYRTETTNADGTKTYRFALNAIMADYGYVHLHCIKGANWANTTVTSAKLVKIVETAANFKLKDIKAEADKTVFIGTILGANTISVENEVTNIRNFNGDIVTPAKLSTNAGKLIITTESPLPRGDYRVHIVPGILKLNGNVYEGALDCILAVGEKDEAALNAYENDFANEIETASWIKEDLIYGVNLFQYAPGLKKKIQAEMDEAEYYAELLVEEEHIYNVIAKLRMYMKSLRPILPQTDKEYRIKHKPTGLYLNISGDKVILSENPTPVQFHLTEPSEGPWCWKNKHESYGYYEQIWWTSHAAYIYTTPERKYLGYNIEEKEVGEGDDKYTYKAPVSTNKKNTVWYIDVNHTNNYEIYIAYDYNNNGEEGYYDWLYAPSDAEEGADVTCDDKMIGYGDDEMVEITPIIDNGIIVITPNNPLPGQLVKPIEDQIPGYMWFIEDYIAPEVPETTPEVTESSEEATAISAVEAAANATAIFNAAGARTNTLQKGINIVKMANGKVVKIMK